MTPSDWAALGAVALLLLNTAASIVTKRVPSAENDRVTQQAIIDSLRATEKAHRDELAECDKREEAQMKQRRAYEQFVRRELRYVAILKDSIDEEALTVRKRIWARVQASGAVEPDARMLDIMKEAEE